MADDAKLTERMDDLEVKFAFQQETIETLNSAVTDQWTEIDRLKKSLAQLQGQIADLEDSQGPADPGNIKPPHY
ncbi:MULTISPECIES: SlyX family protein [Kordiimonas]|jgi:SlyX protein|uniref:Protein SlyX homolog n=1 Tax=Kordiimonas lacus TaxID=637679 RepID=A0A1G6UES5_9PROT|nr:MULTISPECIES: SlyX family protein [Kordiimonas]SDD39900.1 SlyX protein [Kordiimonas lacus]